MNLLAIALEASIASVMVEPLIIFNAIWFDASRTGLAALSWSELASHWRSMGKKNCPE